MTAEFDAAYRARYSFLMDRPLVVGGASRSRRSRPATSVSARKGSSRRVTPAPPGAQPGAGVRCSARGRSWRTVPLYRRERLRPGDTVVGPAIIAEDDATTVVDDGWQATVTPHGHLLLDRVRAHGTQPTSGRPSTRSCWRSSTTSSCRSPSRWASGWRSTAQSVNIKERLDFSCALFDADGNLIANAPHMPVHLGSMGASIKEVLRRNAGNMRPGEVYAINDPYHGGTHLPDVTVVTPVYDDDGQDLLFFVASRGHHAEIGGLTPGSMPAFSRNVHEEGVLFDNWLLVADGRLREAETLKLLTQAPFPSREPAAPISPTSALRSPPTRRASMNYGG